MAGRGWLLFPGSGWRLEKARLTEDTGPLGNPAAGWCRIYDFPLEVPAETVLSQWQMDEGERLAFLLVNIGAYRGRELDESALENLRKCLAFFRSGGRELIVRGVYDSAGRGAQSEPAQFERVCRHLRQLAQVVREFQDVVFVYQGMLLGSWGEMHSSRFLTGPRMQELLDILEQTVGETTFLAVRRPYFYRMLRQKSQTEETRLGLFDDAIFGSETDLGTFGGETARTAGWEAPWLPEEELAFEETLCRRVPQGGEALLAASGPPTLKTAVRILHQMHITYLNSQYDPALLDVWSKQRWSSRDGWNGMSGRDYIGAHLGYRFRVRGVSVRTKGGVPELSVDVENVGFAPLYHRCRLALLQKTPAGEEHRVFLEGDLQGLTAGNRLLATGQLRPESSALYLQLFRESDGREIRFGTQSPDQPENTKPLGLFLGRLESSSP